MLKILQTKVVDRLIKDIWASKVDVSGSLMDNSSTYAIVRHGRLSYNYDFEFRSRFYNKDYTKTNNKPHEFTFRVWAESIKLRYFVELVLYACLLISFQYYVSEYVKDLHKLMDGLANYQTINKELADFASETNSTNSELDNMIIERELLR